MENIVSKIALVIGHNARAQGAIRATDGRTEYDWNTDLANALRDAAPGVYTVIRRTAGTGEIGRAYAQVNASGAAASVELHFNSVATPQATGTETLTSGTTGSLRLARLIQPAMVGALGLRDRGLITIRKDAADARGKASLWTGRPPAVLLEPYFGSNPTDCQTADRQFNALVRAIHGACLNFLKG